ncbi:type 1 fimbrial protein [Providencia rettgeri]|uniref:Fimbrial protein n=4 Tax=Providencia TaxID=586 RepID=A0AA42K0S1_9GAMM|nr:MULTISPECIES: fimbrial protein [Providencia]HCI97191.1 fimbrial protein [Providencia sp.]EIL1984328.1 type 1 fimbrial protein [Providencia rettgeri]EIU7555617.1 type 1 fimbrial protein [Providencia rettgeri]EIU9516821.1 type 1 fimbrial protein [Providencia rettgeri]EJD6080118.1 type 1 fimbrial protein [Providencia rettgeri]
MNIVLELERYRHALGGMLLVLLATTVNATELDKVDNWDVDGANGTLYVHGALTESACRLAMTSANQTIDLGTIGTGQLQQVGQSGPPIAVVLRLEDCLSGESRNRNQLGDLLWSPDMPAMKIRFLAPADKQNPSLAAVIGAKGIALEFSDATHSPIALGQYSLPHLVSPGQNQLTYYVTPVRTTMGLNAGAYSALIRFQLNYD